MVGRECFPAGRGTNEAVNVFLTHSWDDRPWIAEGIQVVLVYPPPEPACSVACKVAPV